MKSFIRNSLAAIACSVLLPLSASAAVLDFVNDPVNGADGAAGERGVEDGTRLQFDGLWIEFSATADPGEGYAYFDAGTAGLGVCGVIDSGAQCDPSSDDNLTFGETLTLTFYDAAAGGNLVEVILGSIVFRDKFHNLITAGSSHDGGHSKTFLLDGVAQDMVGFSTAAAQSSFTFGYDGTNDSRNQYYISSITTPVPEPAMLAMLLTGLVGLGLTRRRARA